MCIDDLRALNEGRTNPFYGAEDNACSVTSGSLVKLRLRGVEHVESILRAQCLCSYPVSGSRQPQRLYTCREAST